MSSATKSRAMNAMKHSYEPKWTVKDTPKVKTVGLEVGVADHHLEATIKAAFDLAKSAGRELDLTFGTGHSNKDAFSRLRGQ